MTTNGRNFVNFEAYESWNRFSSQRQYPNSAPLFNGGFWSSTRMTPEEVDEFAAFSPELPEAYDLASKADPAPGQIRRILAKAAPEDMGKLYKPPLIIVLEASNTPLPIARVAQLHDEPDLAGEGDIRLPNGYFAESWNVYPMLPEFLGPVLDTVPEDIVAEIQRAAEAPLPEVDSDTPLQAMRQMEVETGFYFNSKGYDKIMNQLDEEKPDIKSAKISPFSPADDEPVRPEKIKKYGDYWKLLGMAACVVLIVSALFLNKFISGPDETVNPQPTASLADALRLYLASGGEATRGEPHSQYLPGEDDEIPAEMPQKWQAYAAGQWAARAEGSQKSAPFPKEWLPHGDSVASWSGNPYYNLGFAAYAADKACETGKMPVESLADPLAQTARELKKTIPSTDFAAVQFIDSLLAQPQSCAVIQEKLDALESTSPLY